jgi:hypothetical protein
MNKLSRLRSLLLSSSSFRTGLGGIALVEALVGVPLLCYGVLHGSGAATVTGALLALDGLASTDVLNKLSR